MVNRNYWMFRVKFPDLMQECLNEGNIRCGWDADLVNDTEDKIRRDLGGFSKRSVGMALKFKQINEGDIIVMPRPWGGIAVGEAKSKEFLRDKGGWFGNSISVEWLCAWYPRKDLSSQFQSSLKYQATFLNLWRYEGELESLIASGFRGLKDNHSESREKHTEELVEQISEHINKSANLSFGDTEFEKFIMHLFELNFPGLVTEKNTAKKEKEDGRDFTAHLDVLGIAIQLNVQVKQHQGYADHHGLNQISRSDADDPYVKNVLVTTGKATEELNKLADDKHVTLIDNKELATMIVENFHHIGDFYRGKLGLLSTIAFSKDLA